MNHCDARTHWQLASSQGDSDTVWGGRVTFFVVRKSIHLAELIGQCNFSAAMSDRKSNTGIHIFEGWAFGKINYIFFTIGVALLLVGYTAMATGSVNSFQSLTLARE